jgi:hypothetical protein
MTVQEKSEKVRRPNGMSDELALVREAGVRGDLPQGQVASRLQELLGPLDAAGDAEPDEPN